MFNQTSVELYERFCVPYYFLRLVSSSLIFEIFWIHFKKHTSSLYKFEYLFVNYQSFFK
jgi:hypothetical protein